MVNVESVFRAVLSMKRKRILTSLCLGALVLMIWLKTPVFKIRSQLRGVFVYKDKMMTKSTNRQKLQQFQPSSDIKFLSHQKIIIIIAYMRTGSTFTASVLQEYPGTFYLFEPIRTAWEKFEHASNNSRIKMGYPNGSVRIYQKGDKETFALDEVKSWMTCKIYNLSMGSLFERFHRRKTYLMKSFQACAVRNKSRKLKNPDTFTRKDTLQFCIKNISDRCREAPMFVLKLIRLPMKRIRELFPLFPNLKVVHLNRDPRGIFNSRSHLHDAKDRTPTIEIQMHCERWSQDLAVSKELSLRYPDRFYQIRYEDIAETPHSAFEKLSEFVGIPFTDEMADYVASITSAPSDACKFCVQRKNSTITAIKWRRQLKFTFADYIYDTCKLGNTILNYRRFLNEFEMRNLSIPSYF